MSLGLAVLSYVTLLSSPGLHVMGSRDVAASAEGSDRLPTEIISLRLVLALALLVLTSLIILVVVDSASARIVIIGFSSTAIPLALSLDWYFQGREKLFSVSVARVVMYVVYLSLVGLLVSSPHDIVWTAVAFWIANLAASAWLLLIKGRENGSLMFSWNPRRWKSMLVESLPLGVSSLLTQTILNLPLLLVGVLLSNTDVGLFSAAMKLVFFVFMVDRVFYAMFLPVISRYRNDGIPKFVLGISIGIKVVLGVTIPLVIAGITYSSEIIALVYGATYMDAGPALKILLIYFAFSTLNTVFMCALIADTKEKAVMRAMSIGTTVLVGLCALLPLLFGIEGTSAGLAIGEFLIAMLLLRQTLQIAQLNFVRIALPAFLSGLVMISVVFLLRGWSPLLVIVASALAFLIALLSLRGLSREDLRFLKERFV